MNHTFPDDLDILLVAPGGQNAILMSDVGGATDAVNVTLTLDDAAANSLPDATALSSGTFRPANFVGTGGEVYPPPAPTPAGGSMLSVFNGTAPNGTWRLYVVDDQDLDIGNINMGWTLNITTTNCGQIPMPNTGLKTAGLFEWVNPTTQRDLLLNFALVKFHNGAIY